MGFWREGTRNNERKIDLCSAYGAGFYKLFLQTKERESGVCIEGGFWNSFALSGLLFGRCITAVEKEVISE